MNKTIEPNKDLINSQVNIFITLLFYWVNYLYFVLTFILCNVYIKFDHKFIYLK